MLHLDARYADAEYSCSFHWKEDLTYPIYWDWIGFYYVKIILSHGAQTEIGERFKYFVDPTTGRSLYKIREGDGGTDEKSKTYR